MKTRSKMTVDEGLAELSGVAVCAGPGCYIQLKPGQGRRHSDGRVTCHQRRCVEAVAGVLS